MRRPATRCAWTTPAGSAATCSTPMVTAGTAAPSTGTMARASAPSSADGLWLFRYGTPCKYVWDGPNSILLHSESRDQEGEPDPPALHVR